jgi:hypothetical protein
MASRGERGDHAAQQPTVPKDFANVTPQTPMVDYSFTLQAVMELQKTVAGLATKTDRLIDDVDKQSVKIDGVRHQITFVKGAVWVFGGLFALAGVVLAALRLIPH